MVVLSENETRHFGLRIGRYNTNSIDPGLIREAMEQQALDVVRVRTSVRDEFAVKKLYETGQDFYFSGGVRRYRVNVWDAPLPDLIHPETRFERFDGSRTGKTELAAILNDTWGQYPIGYYRTPVLAQFIDKSIEMKALLAYYAGNYDQRKPDHYLWLMRYESEIVGFIALNILTDQSAVDSTIAGISRANQKKGHFIDVLRHIRGFCRDHQLDYFMCGARMENIRSQRAFESEHMECHEMEYIFHVLRKGLSEKLQGRPGVSQPE